MAHSMRGATAPAANEVFKAQASPYGDSTISFGVGLHKKVSKANRLFLPSSSFFFLILSSSPTVATCWLFGGTLCPALFADTLCG